MANNGNGKVTTVDPRLAEIKKIFPKSYYGTFDRRPSVYIQNYEIPYGTVHLQVATAGDETLGVIARVSSVGGVFDAVKFVDTPNQAIAAIPVLVDWIKSCKKAGLQFLIKNGS